MGTCKHCGAELWGRADQQFCDNNNKCKMAYWRKQQRQDQAQGRTFTEMLSELADLKEKCESQAQTITELEQENIRLLNKLDVERRFHNDHSTYSFPSWLKKQVSSPLRDKLLAPGSLLPARTSRAKYEYYLRYTLHGTPEEMDEFAHLWKAMLLQQS